MADIDDRGQLLLVTGFAIAVAIVALVLLLNTSIYMENRATRSVDTGTEDALAYRDTVADGLWPVIKAENEREYANRGALRGNVSDRIDRFTNQSGYWHLRYGAGPNVTNVTLHDGTWLRQTKSGREMTNASGTAGNWTMVTGVEDVRAFDVTPTSSLSTTIAGAFRVDVVGTGGDRWSLYVYDDGGTTLAVKNGTDPSPASDVCGGLFSNTPAVGLTAGTVNGTDCSALQFAKGVNPPYVINVTHGTQATGTYNATVNATTNVEGSNFNGPGPASSPYRVPVVYGVEADVVYRSADLEYRAQIHLPEDDG